MPTISCDGAGRAGPGCGGLFFFEEAVLMMKLPRRYATPWKGGRLAPIGCGGPRPGGCGRRRGGGGGSLGLLVDYDHDVTVIWMLLAHTGTASLRTLHWQSRTGAHGH